MASYFFLNRLRLSLLWFALLAAALSALFVTPLAMVAPNLGELAIAAVPASMLSGTLFWWLFIVHPRQITVRRGVLAGILSAILALFLMWVIWGIASGDIFGDPMAILFLDLLTIIAVILTPLGWVMIALGACGGGSLAYVTRRWALNETPETL
jgi:hypothetical protein